MGNGDNRGSIVGPVLLGWRRVGVAVQQPLPSTNETSRRTVNATSINPGGGAGGNDRLKVDSRSGMTINNKGTLRQLTDRIVRRNVQRETSWGDRSGFPVLFLPSPSPSPPSPNLEPNLEPRNNATCNTMDQQNTNTNVNMVLAYGTPNHRWLNI